MPDVQPNEITVDRSKANVIRAQSTHGSIVVTRRAPDVILYRMEGHVLASMFEPTMVFANEAVLQHPTIALLGDGEVWKNYEPAYRSGWTSWLSKNRRHVREAHLLTGSAFIRMGALAINMVLGNEMIHIYKQRGEFERVLARMTTLS